MGRAELVPAEAPPRVRASQKATSKPEKRRLAPRTTSSREKRSTMRE